MRCPGRIDAPRPNTRPNTRAHTFKVRRRLLDGRATMADVWVILLAGSAMVLVGFLAAQLFDRFRFPDYFILLAIGLVIGSGVVPTGGLDVRGSLETVAPFLTKVALAFILFEGGLVLHVRGMKRAWGTAAAHTFGAMALATLGMWLVAVYGLGLASTTGVILALAFCGPSATIVLSFLPRVSVSDLTRFTLTVEGVVGNIVAAVLVLLLVNSPGAVTDLSAIAAYVVPLLLAVVLAWIAGEAWALAVGRRGVPSFAYMTSVALAVLLYAVGEGMLDGNGGLAAFVFGLVLGHGRVLTGPATGSPGARGLRGFHRELVFLLRTFFFLYLGMQVTITSVRLPALAGAVAFTAVFYVSRVPSSAALGRVWRLPALDRGILRATVGRGMTDTVLILFAVAEGVIPPSEASLVTDLLFLVIVAAAFASAVLVFRAERVARRVPAPAPSASAVAAPPPPEPSIPPDLDRALSEFLADPIVKQGEID